MAAHNIDMQSVQTAVAHATSAKPVGRLMGAQALTLNMANGPAHAADYAPLIVSYRNGAPVRLRDIAEVGGAAALPAHHDDHHGGHHGIAADRARRRSASRWWAAWWSRRR
jgi:multidrug efflux pump subunit AcrB